MKKFFKNRVVMGSLVTVILSALGISQIYAPVVTDVACAQVKCDAA